MDQEGREQGGGGEVVNADEVIHQLVSEKMRTCIEKQFSKKGKVLTEIKEKFEQHSEEEMELKSLSSTNKVLKALLLILTVYNLVLKVIPKDSKEEIELKSFSSTNQV